MLVESFRVSGGVVVVFDDTAWPDAELEAGAGEDVVGFEFEVGGAFHRGIAASVENTLEGRTIGARPLDVANAEMVIAAFGVELVNFEFAVTNEFELALFVVAVVLGAGAVVAGVLDALAVVTDLDLAGVVVVTVDVFGMPCRASLEALAVIVAVASAAPSEASA